MKRIWVIGGTVLSVIILILAGCKGPVEAEPEKWTILAYCDGNNDLDLSQNNTSFVIEDIQDLEEVGSTDRVKVIAMLGSLKTGGLCKYYYVEKHIDELPDSVSSIILKDLGTKDMSDPTTLTNFIKYGVENYPADHYVLILDDHGGGWRGALCDEQNGAGDLMSMQDIKKALSDGGVKFDVIVFHACLMSMVEVAYELKDRADFMVASQFVMPLQSVLGCEEWLGGLVNDPDMEPGQLAENIVNAVYNAGEAKGKKIHMAKIDLSGMTTLASKIGDLGNHLVSEVETEAEWNEVLDAFNNTHYTQYDDPAFVDLREYAKKVRQEPTIGQKPLINSDASAVIDAMNAAVPYTKTNVAGLTRGGLCIHFPWKQELFDSTNYVKLDFKATNWYAFLSKFIASIGGGGGSTITITGTVTWPGHTLSANCYAFLDTSHTEAIVPLNLFQADPATGNYTITETIAGPLEAYVEAWDDVNGNGQLDVGDGLGFYDANGDGNWNDMLTFNPGDQLSNANISLFEITGKGEIKSLKSQ